MTITLEGKVITTSQSIVSQTNKNMTEKTKSERSRSGGLGALDCTKARDDIREDSPSPKQEHEQPNSPESQGQVPVCECPKQPEANSLQTSRRSFLISDILGSNKHSSSSTERTVLCQNPQRPVVLGSKDSAFHHHRTSLPDPRSRFPYPSDLLIRNAGRSLIPNEAHGHLERDCGGRIPHPSNVSDMTDDEESIDVGKYLKLT